MAGELRKGLERLFLERTVCPAKGQVKCTTVKWTHGTKEGNVSEQDFINVHFKTKPGS